MHASNVFPIAHIFCRRNRKVSKGFNWAVRIFCFCALIRGLQNLGTPCKGTDLFFSLVRKERGVHQRFGNLWTPGTIQIAGRYGVFAKMTGIYQVTGNAESCSFPGIGGNDLNRCDAPALQRKELSEHKKNSCILCKQ